MKLDGLTEIESMPHADEELGELGMVARRLAAQAHLGAGGVRRLDDVADHPFDRLVLLVEQIGQLF
jgi:hypothetical protein